MTRNVLIILIVSISLLAACGGQSAAPAGSTTATQPMIPPTSTPEPTATLVVTPSSTPFVPFEVTTAVDYVNIRNNPGVIFAVKENVRLGTVLEVLGQCPGGEWINVRSGSGASGWVLHTLLQTAQDLQTIPIIQPQNVQLVTGKVLNASGQPVSGISFYIQSGSGTDAPFTRAATDANGVFYAFLPGTVTGDWQVFYDGIECSSNLMDENCKCINSICGTADPTWQTVTIPQAQPLSFGWK